MNGASWISIGWDGWQFGQKELLTSDTTLVNKGIMPEEGVKVFVGHPTHFLAARHFSGRVVPA